MNIFSFFNVLIPSLLLGYFLGKFKPRISSISAKFIVNFGVPISLLGLLLESGLSWKVLASGGIACTAILLTILLIKTIAKYQNKPTLLLGSVFGNSGYFGIPISLALLPKEAFSFIIGYDLGSTLLIWSIGPIYLSISSHNINKKIEWEKIFISLTTSPAIKALLGFFLIKITPWSQSITSALWLPSKMVISLALVIIGMRLAALIPSENLITRRMILLIQPSLLIKLFLLPLLMCGLSMFLGLPSLMRNSLVIQASTPTAISVLLLAESRNQDQDLATCQVVWSTLIAIITVPIWSILLP